MCYVSFIIYSLHNSNYRQLKMNPSYTQYCSTKQFVTCFKWNTFFITRRSRKNTKNLYYEHIGRGAIWSDAGKIKDMTNVSAFVQSVENVQSIKVACLEEIALSKKWINKKTIINNISFYGNCDYSNYLKKL